MVYISLMVMTTMILTMNIIVYDHDDGGVDLGYT